MLNASIRNPRTTLIELSHPPDLGNLVNKAGKRANSVNGRANASPNANIPTVGLSTSPLAASTSNPPTIGPVQENDTITVVNAMKNAASKPPLSTFESALFAHLLGSTISNAPKNETANKTKSIKNIVLGIQCVLRAFANPAPAPVREIIIPGEA